MKPSDDIAIRLTDVSKKYEIHHEKPTLVEKFIKGKNETFWALTNVNLTIKKGERVGIIGPNGSGKTTLLKIIAGITSPTKGKITTYGKIVSLIDLEAGFHPDLSGIQNIYLNGILLGMNKQNIASSITSIIRFANIKQFIDAPVYTYSQGMKLRLGFSIAVHSNPDILLLDENIAVGDADFQEKSKNWLNDYYKKGKTQLIASHMTDILNPMCDRIISVIKGKISKIR